MSVKVRPLADRDFFRWLGLYESYAEHYDTTVTDQIALRAWGRITDDAHELDAFIAIDVVDEIVGFVHYRSFVRPLTGAIGVAVEDLFVVESARESGIATALLDAVTAEAKQRGATSLTLSAAPDDAMATTVYDAIAQRSDVVTWEKSL